MNTHLHPRSSLPALSGQAVVLSLRQTGPALITCAVLALTALVSPAQAAPTVVDPNLAVRTAVTGLTQPIGLAFVDRQAFLVTEKASGRVKYVVDGAVVATALDLAVNSASERGLLGITVHPKFKQNHFVYLYWTESSTGSDTTNLAQVPLLGNRVDRFVWNEETMTLNWDRNIVKLRAYQADPGQPLRGNHNGGVIRFQKLDNEDGDESAKLLVVIGDNGRRGQTQNLQNGPFGPGIPDDQFGGPEPDAAHLTGVVLRLNDDGSTPMDNPFYAVGAAVGGEVGESIQKVFAYGVRNSFGLAVDPKSGALWEVENGDDSYDEINRIQPGFNGGWIQTMGPLSRVADFKAIETTPGPLFGLQQLRWPPTNLADTAAEAEARLVKWPGSTYTDPVFSWRFAVAPSCLGFVETTSLGSEYKGDILVGAARTFGVTGPLANGFLFRFQLTPDRDALSFDDERLADLVADNTAKFDVTESESLLFGTGFGVVTDIVSGPKENVYLVSSSAGEVYEIYRTGKGRGRR